MGLSNIFNVFSRRPEAATKPRHDVPRTTRNRIIDWWMQHFRSAFATVGADMRDAFWGAIHDRLRLRLGRHQLSEGHRTSQVEDAAHYLASCPGEQFLDFLEDLFRTQFYDDMRLDNHRVVDELNELLRVDDLPYHVTKFVTETLEREQNGRRTVYFSVLARPKVIMRESEVMHANAMEPALQLLQNPAFANANKEFLAALEDYRQGDYSDSLTKCGSSFESFMKILCAKKRWAYKETDTAGPLVKAILANTTLDGYFDPLLMIVGTLRNKLSSAHGAGTAAKAVPQHLARYAINATASAMLLLADEARV